MKTSLNKTKVIVTLCLLSLFMYCTSDDGMDMLFADDGEELSGGSTGTSFNFSREAFEFRFTGISNEESGQFVVGNSLFEQNWVTAPASTTARDGLGPFFNARACSSCHFKDGRGRALAFDGELNTGFLVQMSVPGASETQAPTPHPMYGPQFQDQAILGQLPDGSVQVIWEDVNGTYDDGTAYTLRKPNYDFVNLNYGALGNIQFSPRVAPQVIGLGLLEAVEESTILAMADESDVNGDGISGKPNYVLEHRTGQLKLGRFGWKANQPSLEQQNAGAFVNDMGLTNPIFTEAFCPPTVDCDALADGGNPEVPEASLEKVTTYTRLLAVPGRRDYETQEVLRGKQSFLTIGCGDCHRPSLNTGSTAAFSVLENQTIRPFTDLLLHDMGPGLADGRPEFRATGQEWRTPPLWGIGLIETVNEHTNLLHDGRARNMEEAILWHGGEAETAKDKFKALSQTEREELLLFLKSL